VTRSKLLKVLMAVGWFLMAAQPAFAGGWYLMKPPLALTGATPKGIGFDYHAPLSQWTQEGEFESFLECEYLRNIVSRASHEQQHKTQDVYIAEADHGAMAERCVATDDPRLQR
jgi:hypothetical protein